MQTPIKTYTIKWVANFKESLFDDFGQVKELPIGNDLVTAFDWLSIYPDENRRIIAQHKRKFYGFTADLTPIALEIKGKQVTAFDGLYFYPDGKIKAQHEGKFYGFTADLTPITLPIGNDLVTAFDWLSIYPDENGRIIAQHKRKGKYYGFNADLTPIVLEIEGALRVAFEGLEFYLYGRIKARHEGKFYYFNLDGTLIA